MTDRIGAFADWAAGLRLAAVPDDVVTLARVQVANQLGAAAASLAADWEELTATMRRDAPSGGCSLVTGGRSDPATAIAVNQTLGMALDYDDYCFLAHSGHSAVFSTLAASEANDRDGAAFLKGVVAATELAGRLGASCVFGPHNGQQWTFAHSAVTAAVTAMFDPAGGDADSIADAVRHALAHPPYATEPGFVDGDSKVLAAASASEHGYRCGQLAVSGGRGAANTLEGENGFLERYSYLPVPEALSGWGQSWVTRTLSVKPAPGCAYLQAPLEALERILADRALAPADVERVTVRAGLPTVGMEAFSDRHRDPARRSPVTVTFSVADTLATRLVTGQFDETVLSRAAIRAADEAIGDLAGRVEVEHDWELSAAINEGLGPGFDTQRLFRDRDTATVLGGLRALRAEHDWIDAAAELQGLLTSGAAWRVLTSVGPDESWDALDLAHADFDAVELSFGASVTVETVDGDRYSATVDSHRGSCADTIAVRRDLAASKLRSSWGRATDEAAASRLADLTLSLGPDDRGALSRAIRRE